MKNTIGDLILQTSPYDQGQLNRSSDLAIYVTYTKSGRFFRHHLRQVKDLQAAGYFVVGVHAVRTPHAASKQQRLADIDILKPNVGYDFGSYWVGMQWLSDHVKGRLQSIRSIILMNDSCFGRVSAEMMARIQGADGDLIGVFDSHEQTHHIQSFFVCAKGRPLRSGAFTRAILSYEFADSKYEVIRNGELKLSADMKAMGYKLSSIADYTHLSSMWLGTMPSSLSSERRELDAMSARGSLRSIADVTQQYLRIFFMIASQQNLNPSHFFALEAIRSGITLVKRELLFYNPVCVPNFLSIWSEAISQDLLSASEALDYIDAEGLTANSIWMNDLLNKLSADVGFQSHPNGALQGLS